MRYNFVVATMLTAIVALLCSCAKSNEATVVHAGSRDNVTTVTLTSIDDSLPPIHSDARFSVYGDTLIIRDRKSTDKMFKSYDMNKDKYLGSFGLYGQGPGEIANCVNTFFDNAHGVMYGLDLSKWQIVGFNLKEAIADSTYKAFVKIKLTDHGGRAIMSPTYINDSTVLCSVYVPNETGMSLSSTIGRFNMLTGEMILMDSIATSGRHTAGMVVSIPHSLIIETGSTHDRIRLYNMDGNLIKTIYGPAYEERHDGHTYYYSSSIIAGDKLLSVYSGMDARKQVTGHEIIVMDLDGNYIKTLDIGARIASIAYHDKTDRVYVSQDGEPQFGYFNLSEALGDSAYAKKDSKSAAEDVPVDETIDETANEAVQKSETTDVSGQGNEKILDNGVKVAYSSPMAANTPGDGPMALLDPLAHSFNPVDIATIGGEPNGKNGKLYRIALFNNSKDTVAIESVLLPDSRFEVVKCTIKKYLPHLTSDLVLKSNKAVKLDDYRFVLTYKGGKYPPQTFHINLHPDIIRLMEERDGATDE